MLPLHPRSPSPVSLCVLGRRLSCTRTPEERVKVVSPSDRRRTRAASAVIALLAALSVLGSGSIGSGSAARATTLDSALGP
jgi:hypothetical protein